MYKRVKSITILLCFLFLLCSCSKAEDGANHNRLKRPVSGENISQDLENKDLTEESQKSENTEESQGDFDDSKGQSEQVDIQNEIQTEGFGQTENILKNDDQIDEQTDEQTNEHTVEQTDDQTGEQTDEQQTEGPSGAEESDTLVEASTQSIRLVMVGDMLMHNRVMTSGLREDGTYSFSHLFSQVKERIQEADLALVNQETILGGAELGLSGYPCFNSPYELGEAEVEAGFDVILHGTNHSLDMGKTGVEHTLAFWDQYAPEVTCLGINRSQEEQDEFIYVYEQDGIRIAILNYTYGTNGIPTPKGMPYVVNYLDRDKIEKDLKKAEEIADFTVVCPHWGTEYNLGISTEQEKWTQLFLEGGADLIIGTHPHVIEPVEWVYGEDGAEMLVYYSLGNFVNGTASTGEGVMNRCVGGMAEVEIGREDDGTVEILEYSVHPLVCHIDEGEAYTVYYLEDYTEELAEKNRILNADPTFSLENCIDLVEQVWGNLP